MEKEDSMEEKMGNISRDGDSKKEAKEMIEIKDTATCM